MREDLLDGVGVRAGLHERDGRSRHCWPGRRSWSGLALRRWPLPAAVLAATILFVAAGCLAAQALLMWTGVAVPEDFWRQYLAHTARARSCCRSCSGLERARTPRCGTACAAARRNCTSRKLADVRAEQLVAEARLRSLESRLHPHFLFNTLNSISALIMLDPPRADRIVGRLSALLALRRSTRARGR